MEELATTTGLAYLRSMKLTLRFFGQIAASAVLLLATACSQAPDAEKEPSADAEYKRAHRTEGYREAQRSNVNY